MNAYKIYPTLDLTEKMPQFPFDFVSAILMATVPPLWTWLVNPLVDEVIEGKKVGVEHRKYVHNAFNLLRVALLINFVVRVLGYVVL